MKQGISVTTFYFEDEGRHHMKKAAQLAAKRGKDLAIKHFVVFTRDGEGAVLLKDLLQPSDASVVAVTFPYKHPLFVPDESGEYRDLIPETSVPKTVKYLTDRGIELVRGTAPFTEGFFIPGVRDPKLEGIRYALQLFSSGLHLCVQAVAMATDAGAIEPGDEVIAMSADTAIVARASSSRYVFHPTEGMEIREIICKPRQLTLRDGERRGR
ncbi:MAG: hypothetical protein ACM3ZA_05855 [Bacillota bacterium]